MYVNIGIARKPVAKIFLYETKTHEKIILEELQKMGYLTIYLYQCNWTNNKILRNCVF
jgi:hypothetical protein